jgi:polyhydroxyalkanoate synthase
MSATEGHDLAAIPDRIQSEMQRAIQRSIKGVEYISSAGPSLGSTPKDTLAVRGTMNLYHYRPMAEEVYRPPGPDRDGNNQPRLHPRIWCLARVLSSSC